MICCSCWSKQENHGRSLLNLRSCLWSHQGFMTESFTSHCTCQNLLMLNPLCWLWGTVASVEFLLLHILGLYLHRHLWGWCSLYESGWHRVGCSGRSLWNDIAGDCRSGYNWWHVLCAHPLEWHLDLRWALHGHNGRYHIATLHWVPVATLHCKSNRHTGRWRSKYLPWWRPSSCALTFGWWACTESEESSKIDSPQKPEFWNALDSTLQPVVSPCSSFSALARLPHLHT